MKKKLDRNIDNYDLLQVWADRQGFSREYARQLIAEGRLKPPPERKSDRVTLVHKDTSILPKKRSVDT